MNTGDNVSTSTQQSSIISNSIEHWLMSQLSVTTPLYWLPMPSCRIDLEDIYKASRRLSLVMLVNHVSCDQGLSEIKEIADFVQFNLRMWTSNHNTDSTFVIPVVMPSSWTQSIYLGFLELSVIRNKILIIETIMLNGVQCYSINDIHLSFHTIDRHVLETYLSNRSSIFNTSTTLDNTH